jgi:hypothetical protein
MHSYEIKLCISVVTFDSLMLYAMKAELIFVSLSAIDRGSSSRIFFH